MCGAAAAGKSKTVVVLDLHGLIGAIVLASDAVTLTLRALTLVNLDQASAPPSVRDCVVETVCVASLTFIVLLRGCGARGEGGGSGRGDVWQSLCHRAPILVGCAFFNHRIQHFSVFPLPSCNFCLGYVSGQMCVCGGGGAKPGADAHLLGALLAV